MHYIHPHIPSCNEHNHQHLYHIPVYSYIHNHHICRHTLLYIVLHCDYYRTIIIKIKDRNIIVLTLMDSTLNLMNKTTNNYTIIVCKVMPLTGYNTSRTIVHLFLPDTLQYHIHKMLN